MSIRSYSRCVGLLLSLAGLLVLPPVRAADDPPATGIAAHQDLVELLGDASFTARESASNQLIKLGSAAEAALAGGRRHPDPEIRFRCKRILAVIDFQAREQRLAAFLSSSGDSQPLAGWERFSEIAGDDKQARKLFVEMYRSEWDLLETLRQNPKQVAEKFTQRCEFLRQASQAFRQQLSLGSVATVVFLASDQELKVGDVVGSTIYSFCYQQSFRGAIANGPHKDQLRSILGRWVANNTSQNTAYQGLMLAMNHDLKEGLAPAKRILEQQGMPQHYKQYALLAVAKLGAAEDRAFLEKYLDDATPCSAMTVTNGKDKIVYQTQIRDVALAALIHLSRKEVKDFGFERAQTNTQMIFNTNSLGFVDDKQRAEARKKWDKFRDGQAEQPAPAVAEDPPPSE